MGFTDSLRADVRHIWGKIFSHPFVTQLFDGTLPIRKFKYYIIQDYNYLISVMKCFSLIAAKADPSVSAVALEIAHTDATTELENYKKLLMRLNLSFEEVINTEPAPTNLAYMNYLLVTCSLGIPLEGLIALLPCFWSYLEIAEKLRGKLAGNKVELYREWCMTYLSSEYRKLVQDLRNLIDGMWDGRNYGRYLAIFTKSSKYEYMFWDMAYREEQWPI